MTSSTRVLWRRVPRAALRNYCAVWGRWAQFRGRASRSEYWPYVLVCAAISITLAVLDGWLASYLQPSGVGLLGGAYVFLGLLPTVGVTVRRLHDIDSSGWWCLLAMLPVFGALALLASLLLPGSAAPNRFGPAPPYAAAFSSLMKASGRSLQGGSGGKAASGLDR